MKIQYLLLLFLLTIPAFEALSQDDWEDDEEEIVDSTKFFIGVNFAAHFANDNTVEIYSGRPTVTPYGIPYILSLPNNRPVFDAYFQYPYSIAEYPFEPIYRTSFEVGLHAGYNISEDLAIFLDFNITQLDYEQFFTVAINDPTNQIPGPTLENIPIIGEENRIYVNLGTQINYFQDETTKAYLSLYANANDVNMQQNYIVINNVQYDIFHFDPNNLNLRPGGIGYGGGIGTGVKFDLTDNILGDIYYNATYTQSNMTDNLQPFGLQHSLGVRVLWKK